MTKYKPYFPLFILFVPVSVNLILYGYHGGFTRLLADDFCSAYYAKKLGLLRSIWYWYLNWSGRYTAFGTDWVMEKIGAYNLNFILPLLLLGWLVFTTTVLHLFLRQVLPPAKSKVAALSLATVFLFVILILSPNITQSLYWWNGMRSYSLPLILLTLYAVLFQIGVEKLNTKKTVVVGGFVSFLFAVVNGGLGETYIAFQLVLFAFLLGLEWLVNKDTAAPRFVFLLAGLAGSMVSIAIVIASPGNATRQDFFPPHPDVINLFRISIAGYLDFLFEIIKTSKKITGLLGIFLLTIWLGGQSERETTGCNRVTPLVFLGAFALSFACFVPGAYATSEPPPTRALIIPVFALVACLLYTGFTNGYQLANQGYFSRSVDPLLFIMAALLITYSSLVNAQYLYRSRSVYIEFAQKWDRTNALILKAKMDKLESVQIPAMDNWAGIEYPTDNEKYWPNRCYSAYYDINVLAPPYP